jgi:hypothetical protein
MMNISGGQEVTVRKAGLAIWKHGRYFQRVVAGQAEVWETVEGHWERKSLVEQHP